MSQDYEEDTNETPEFTLKLGDIIEIYSPKNDTLNNQTFFIEYINESRIVLLNIATTEQIQLNMDETTGELSDKSIREVRLLSRSEESGYARQNRLVPETWVEIHFGGDIPTILTGEITSLEEDQIEIRTFPEMDMIYIDFEYKGIPEYIPIKNIIIRDKPAMVEAVKTDPSEPGVSPTRDDPHVEYLDTGEMWIHAEENAEEEEHIIDALRFEVAKSKEVIFGEELETVAQYSEIPDSQKRYTIDLQTTNLLDELLSTIPAFERNAITMQKIHALIAHYRELRHKFSVFNESGDVVRFKRNNPLLHKPLVDSLAKLDSKVDWILPVVSLKKKVYVNEEEKDTMSSVGEGDVLPLVFDEVLQEEEATKRNNYYNEQTVMDENRYYRLYQRLEDSMRPFDAPTETPHILSSIEVQASMEAIVDNLDEFYSSVFKVTGESQEGIVRRKYVIQKYDLGLNRRTIQMRGDREVVETFPLTRPDTMSVKSVVLLPASVMNYSRVNLPCTSILEKSNIHMFSLMRFQILGKNNDIPPVVIEDLERDLYEDTDNDDFLKGIRHYVLSDTLRSVQPTFEKVLQTIVPKTKTLVKLIKKYVTNKLSLLAVVEALEPFKVYTDDLSYTQYLEIRRFIVEQISVRKESLDKRRKEYGFLPNYRFPVKPQPLSVINYMMEKTDFIERMLSGYHLPGREFIQKYLTTSEVLVRMYETDNGSLLMRLIGFLMSSLMTPESVSSLFKDDDDSADIKATDCNRRVLTKRYLSVKEMHKDNGTDDVFYDKEFDDTPYHILEKYNGDRKKMLPDKFLRFLMENLIEKHDCPQERAEGLAAALVAGKKRVKDGEYAMLVVRPRRENTGATPLTLAERKKMEDEATLREKTTYYFRKSNQWFEYKDIDEDAFLDTSQLFCNYKENCHSTKTGVGEICESGDETARRMRNIAKKKIKGEFDKRFELTFEDMKSSIETRMNDRLMYLQRWLRIHTVQHEKQNNISYQIGLEAIGYADTVISSYIALRDKILGQTDFVKKQTDIVRFYDRFCREPMDILSEDHGWKYCKETNTKLLPAFLHELALCFIQGEDYQLRLEEMCYSHGLLSDAGNAIVDKNSGFVVRNIDFAEEDGYDEAGFKITTHAFLEKGEMEKVVENMLTQFSEKRENTVCENERNQIICNLLDVMMKHVPLTTAKEYCVRVTNLLCDTMIDTEEKYNRAAKKMEEKEGKKLLPYKKRKNQLTILITAAVFFTAIQTEVPSFNTKRTMPGCVKSFRGYPLDGEEDLSGIKYMACVLSKMEKKIEPWNAIEKMPVLIIQDQLKKILVDVVKHSAVDARYLTKREYMLLHVEDNIPVEHSVEKWFHFLPPLIDFNTKLQPLSSDFKDDFISLMQKGQKQQHGDYMVIKSKVAGFSYRIIENIQEIVQSKDLLLSAVSTGKPFLQNVCCNEKGGDVIPILYFAKENDEILKDIKTVASMSSVIQNVRAISKPPFLYDPTNTMLKYPSISQDIGEQNLYATLIHYCELDKKVRVPAKFHSFFTDIPVDYPNKGSIEEKVDFLKRSGKRFSPNELYELLRIVHSENRVELKKSAKHNVAEKLKDVLKLFDEYQSPVIDQRLRERLTNVLTQYDQTKLMTILDDGDGDTAAAKPEKARVSAVKVLKNGLSAILEDTFKPSILNFLKKYGKLGSREQEMLSTFFETFVKTWAVHDLYKVSAFIKNAVDEMTRVFPNILITNTQNTRPVQSYWDLAPVDSAKIFRSIQTYYEPLGQFRQDTVLRELFMFIKPKFVDLRVFFENIPIQESIHVGTRDYFSLFDVDTIQLLLEYIFLSVLHEYIIATDDVGLIRRDKQEKKKFNREQIAKKGEDDVASEYVDLDEERREVYGDMTEVDIDDGNRDELKTRVAKLLIAFINIIRKNKTEIDISYETIRSAIRKRKENEKNRIVERFKAMSPDERSVEDMKKKFKMDEWNLGTQRGIFEYDKKTSEREVREQEAEEALDIRKHGMRKEDFISIHGDTEDTGDVLREMVDIEDMGEGPEEAEELENEITGLKNHFFDGQYYSEDESDDDFGDD